MNIAYIDAQNIHKGVKLLGREIDWLKLKIYMQEKYAVDEIQIFFGYIPKFQKLYDMLTKHGYIVIFKEVSTYQTGETKGNVDIDIAIKAMNDIMDDRLSQAYLLTTDADYNTLIYEFRRRDIWGKLLVTTFDYTSKYLRKASGSAIQPLSDLKHIIGREQKTE